MGLLALVPLRDLARPRFGEVHRPSIAVRRGELLALAGAFPSLQWAGRAGENGRRLRHRVALYDAGRPVAVFDAAQLPIRDVAFHPSAPVLAIATGAYGGGYLYEGELFVWSWETGATRALLPHAREITHCRFEPDGRLAIVASPWSDADATPSYGAVFDPEIPLAGDDLVPRSPAALGFDDDARHAARARLLDELALERRTVIRDLAWTLDGRLAAACRDRGIELWSTAGTLDHAIATTGDAVQLLRQPDRLLIHVVGGERSQLHALHGNALEPWLELPGRHACSVDAAGRILARAVDRTPPRRDLVIDATGRIVVDHDLGHYDPFNHCLRVDGAAELHFLRGTPASSHLHKRLCLIDPDDLAVRVDLPWDVEPEQRMTGAAVVLDDDLVCCYRVHRGDGGGAIRIERRVRGSGETIWRHAVPAVALALIAWPAVGGVVAALADGSLHVVAHDGTILHAEPFELDDFPTIPTALAVHGETLVIGTIDGRITMCSLR